MPHGTRTRDIFPVIEKTIDMQLPKRCMHADETNPSGPLYAIAAGLNA